MSREVTAELLELLRKKILGPEGQGARAVFLDEVRSGTGFSSARTIDAISVGMWPSHGNRIQAYELKVSRGDWLGELKRPDKAEAIARFADHFWLVTASGIVESGEIPPAWGHLERDGKRKRLLCRREAALLDGEDPSKEFIAAMLRRAVKADLNRERAKMREEAEEDARREVRVELEDHRRGRLRAEEDLAEFKEIWEEFEAKTGLSLGPWTRRGETVSLVGDVVASLMIEGGHGSIRNRLLSMLAHIDEVRENIARASNLLADSGLKGGAPTANPKDLRPNEVT